MPVRSGVRDLRVHPAPGLPCALCSEREQRIGKNLGQIVPRECFRLFENRIHKYRCRPGQAKRDPGPITTGRGFGESCGSSLL
jgi:hypothetical protein